MNSPQEVLLGYFPLYGATFDSEEVGAVGGRVLAYVPNRNEWDLLEKSDISIERAIAHVGTGSDLAPYDPAALQAAPPPLCIVIGEDIPNDDSADERISAAVWPMVQEASDAILSLRLLRSGWFLDPELSMRVFRYQASIFNHRLAGPYRQVGLGGGVETPMVAYNLRLEDLRTEPDGETPLTELSEIVQDYREVGQGAADVAIRNFGHSYGYVLPATARAAVLFTALDALLGGMGARHIGRTRLRSTFKERVEQALLWDGSVEEGWATSEADWLNTEGRTLRNALAHGRPSDVMDLAEQSHERIRAVVRHILGLYLRFCIDWSLKRLPIEVPAAADSPVAAFNAALEA